MEDDYTDVAFDIRYTPETGNMSFEAMDYGYDMSMFYIEGSLEKTDDNALHIGIDTFEVSETELFSGDITIKGTCDEIVRPEGGEEKNVLLMDESEWEAVLMEILMAFYY